jgi:GST-like protein
LEQDFDAAMNTSYTVYGAPGSGSVPVEAALTLIGSPYKVIGDTVLRNVAHNPAIFDVNPLGQIPALVLPSGQVMTESAAILIYLADQHPEARLAPTQADRNRPAFLRWMTYVSTAIYSLAWIRGNPMRLVDDDHQVPIIQERIAERRAECWRHMNDQIGPGKFLLGDELSVLDIYVAIVSRWSPRRTRFYNEAPRIGSIVRRVDNDPRLVDLWNVRFPFTDGWEG